MASLFFSCSDQPVADEQPGKGKPVARVFDHTLYEADLRDVVPEGSSKDDSMRIAENYINTWVKEMLLVHKAELNLSPKEKNVEKQLQSYRNSLIIYAYEKELVRQQLDTVVSEEEIQAYYDSHQEDFTLKDNIVKVLYVKVDKKAPNLARLKSLIRSEKPQDLVDLNIYCKQFAQNYFLDDQVWLVFDDLLKEIPIQTYNKELFLQTNKYVELADTASFYFMNIKGYKTRDSKSPLSFEKENIRNIILNKRKKELIDRMRDDIYKDAMDSKDVQIFKK
ncbi:MAG: hypothetical protein Fur0041_10090 [Bacteroidia bacterium]